jgi:hypothetical protein
LGKDAVVPAVFAGAFDEITDFEVECFEIVVVHNLPVPCGGNDGSCLLESDEA